MSTPISVCQVIAAAKGDEKAFDSLAEAMKYNMTQVAYTMFPCECNPPCEKPTDEQLEKFNKRICKVLDDERKKAKKK